MIVFNKLYCQINENLNFDSQMQQIFGIGTHNNLYKKFGLSKNAHSGILKIIHLNLEFDIEYYILKRKLVSFPLKQEIKDNIRKKIIKKIYQGLRHHLGLPVHGQRTHSNCKTIKKTFNKNITLTTGFKGPNMFKKKQKKTIKKLKNKKIRVKKK